MGSHFEDPVVPIPVEWRGGDGRRRPRCVSRGRHLRVEPAPTDPAELRRRLDTGIRMMERFGLRGGEAEDVAIALLIPKNHPDSIRRVSALDARSAVRNAKRAATARTEAEADACRRRPEATVPFGRPTREMRRETRGRLVSLLREGALLVDPRNLQDFARRLLARWRRDPGSVLDHESPGEGAIQAVFGALLLRRGAEVTAVLGRSAFVRILLRALRLWSAFGPPYRRHRRRPL